MRARYYISIIFYLEVFDFLSYRHLKTLVWGLVGEGVHLHFLLPSNRIKQRLFCFPAINKVTMWGRDRDYLSIPTYTGSFEYLLLEIPSIWFDA